MDTCAVCCDKFNKSNHKKVTCPFCDFESCKKCNQVYMLSSMENPHCMKCKHELNREFIDSFCTKRFRNVEYKKHRENGFIQGSDNKNINSASQYRKLI